MARQDRQRGGKRQTEREKKRKSLGERRKPLNIDHLNTEKLKDKAKELAKWVCVLEEERYEEGGTGKVLKIETTLNSGK